MFPSTASGGVEYVIVEIAMPGVPVENAGVIVLDRETGELRMRFRRDLAELGDADNAEVLEAIAADLDAKAQEMGSGLLVWMEEHLSNVVRVSGREAAAGHDPGAALRSLYQTHVSPKVLPFRTHLPQYSLAAAAGKWGEQMEVEPEGWVEAPEDLRLRDDMFIAHVEGRSMEPLIPAGSLCVFRHGVAGSRQGRIVLAMLYGETGESRFTIKRYRSVKAQTAEDEWQHETIVLEPLNPEYEAWESPADRVAVIAEFVRVLE